MASQSTYQKKQTKAYALAEADGFRQHPDVYWHQAETTPIKTIPKKASPKKGGPKKRSVKAKADKREARMTAKKEAIKGQQSAEAEEGAELAPNAGAETAPADMKEEVVAAPSIAAEKSAAPRKHQGS